MANVARAGRRQILLKGRPNQQEEGVASTTVRPGDLVDGVTAIAPYASAGGNAPRRVAAERDEMGAGVDDLYAGGPLYSPSANYASGDAVKVLSLAPGDRVCMWINSGQNITSNDRLEAAGDGSLRILSSGEPLFVALETYDARNVVGPILIKVEVM